MFFLSFRLLFIPCHKFFFCGRCFCSLKNHQIITHMDNSFQISCLSLSYFLPRWGFGFFSKSDFCAIFFNHFFSSSDSFFKFNLSRLQINAKDACSGSPSSLATSSAVCKKSSSGLSSGTRKKSSLCAFRRSRAILFMCCCIT